MVLYALLLPKLFIVAYGSAVNGLVSSIGQLITYMALVEAGVGAAATVELYRPLAFGETARVSEIVSAARNLYNRLGLAYLGIGLLLGAFYPFVVRREIGNPYFVRMMILVLSINGIVDFFFVGKYRILLVADQKAYVLYLSQAIGTVVVLVSSCILIEVGASAVLVKSVAGLVYLARGIYISYYVKSHYPGINFHAKHSGENIPLRHSVLFHQVVAVLCNNTDMILLTLFLKEKALLSVSIYATYNLVLAGLTGWFNSVSQILRPSFGNIMVGGDEDKLRKNFDYYELLYYVLMFSVYTCMGILLFSFIELYSAKFDFGAVYLSKELVVLFTLSGVVQSVRIPSLTITLAAGHFKQTQVAAVIEVVLNLGVSLALVRLLGIAGVLIGTIVAYTYRSSFEIIYNHRNFVQHSYVTTIQRIIRNLLCFGVIALVLENVISPLIHSWRSWWLMAIALFCGSVAFFVIMNWVFEPRKMSRCIRILLAQKGKRNERFQEGKRK